MYIFASVTQVYAINMQKSHRISTIKQLISQHRISTQEVLLDMLIREGFNTTQATLSRDLKALEVAKIPDKEFGSVYILREQLLNHVDKTNALKNEETTHPISGFVSISFSGNMAVIHTLPAFSHTIAMHIDKANFYEVLGTIAGNDTILLILREGVTHKDVKNSLIIKFPELRPKL